MIISDVAKDHSKENDVVNDNLYSHNHRMPKYMPNRRDG